MTNGKYKFKVLTGSHADEHGIWVEGSVFTTDHELDEMFSNKFERLEHTPPAPAAAKASPAAKPAPERAVEAAGAGSDEEWPDEAVVVTDKFPKIAAAPGLEVQKVEGGYNLVDDGGLVLNEAPLTSQKALTAFAADYL